MLYSGKKSIPSPTCFCMLPLAAISDSGNHADVLLGIEKGPQGAVPRVDQRELMEACAFNTTTG